MQQRQAGRKTTPLPAAPASSVQLVCGVEQGIRKVSQVGALGAEQSGAAAAAAHFQPHKYSARVLVGSQQQHRRSRHSEPKYRPKSTPSGCKWRTCGCEPPERRPAPLSPAEEPLGPPSVPPRSPLSTRSDANQAKITPCFIYLMTLDFYFQRLLQAL